MSSSHCLGRRRGSGDDFPAAAVTTSVIILYYNLNGVDFFRVLKLFHTQIDKDNPDPFTSKKGRKTRGLTPRS